MYEVTSGRPVRLFCFAAVLLALIYNLSLSWALYSKNPLGDPAGYPSLARTSRYFYDSGVREPVPVFLVKASQFLGLSDDLSVRVPTTALACLQALILLLFLAERIGLVYGLAGALILALNPFLGFYCVQGSNNVTVGFFLMCFYFFLEREKNL